MTTMLHQTANAAAMGSNEGRWPRICELSRPSEQLHVAMLCFHTSPLAILGQSRDAGGMNIYVRELAKNLGQRGIAVDIFTRWTDPSLPQIVPLGTNARLIHIPAGPLTPLPKNDLFGYVPAFVAGIDCFAISQHTEYQLIHSHYWLSGVAGLSLAQRWGAPHMTMFHTLARLKQHARPEENESALRIEQERRIIAEVDSIIVATDDERQQIQRLYGAHRGTIHTIPCGVELSNFMPLNRTAARASVAAELRLDDEPLLLYVGRLDPLKGAELLVRTVPLLQTTATLVIVGGDERDPERERLLTLARASGVATRIRMVNAVPHEELSRYYRAADLMAIASHYESFGLVAVEALASGTPVIAARVGGLPTIVQDRINGLLIDHRSPEQFAHGIDALLRDPAEMSRLRAAARPSVRQFGWHAVAGQIADCYATLSTATFARAAG